MRELSRRRRRPKPRRPQRARDHAVLVSPADDGDALYLGPYTRRDAMAVLVREGSAGRRVQLVRVLAPAEGAR